MPFLDVVLLSVAEGDDKPEKYPVIFRNADLVLLTKVDLLPYVGDFDIERTQRAVTRLGGQGRLEQVSVRSSQGLDMWARRLATQLNRQDRFEEPHSEGVGAQIGSVRQG